MERPRRSKRKFPKDTITTNITIRLLPKESQLLDIISIKKGIYKSEFIRRLVQKAIIEEGHSLEE